MLGNKFAGMTGTLLALLLSGCAVKVQQPISINDSFWQNNNKVIGVAMTKVPMADTHLEGAGCLLCYAAASAANSSLTKHMKTMPIDDVKKLKLDVVALLQEKGFTVKIIEKDLDINKLPKATAKAENAPAKNYAGLKSEGVDVVLVLDVQMLGAYRSYSGYVPTSEPQAVFNGTAFMVDLENNNYLWYKSVNHLKAADVAWDEPPAFPGLTKAYYQVLESGPAAMKADLAKKESLAQLQQ